MAIKFNKLVRPNQADTSLRSIADDVLARKSAADKLVFMSHKTGDARAAADARYIADTHRVDVYMAEWDAAVAGDSDELPGHIMNAIRKSDGLLVSVIAAIAESMWIGYEIGGAHAMRMDLARIMHEEVGRLPSVVSALEPLRSRSALDRWIRVNVL